MLDNESVVMDTNPLATDFYGDVTDMANRPDCDSGNNGFESRTPPQFEIDMLDKELYWLIGILEGEGCFSLIKAREQSQPKISLQMTDEDTIAKVANLWSVKYRSLKPRKTHYKICYGVNLTGSRAAALMNQIKDDMSIRRKEKINEILNQYNNRQNKLPRCKINTEEIKAANIRHLNGESLRSIAKSLDINHESLRKRFKALNANG